MVGTLADPGIHLVAKASLFQLIEKTAKSATQRPRRRGSRGSISCGRAAEQATKPAKDTTEQAAACLRLIRHRLRWSIRRIVAMALQHLADQQGAERNQNRLREASAGDRRIARVVVITSHHTLLPAIRCQLCIR